MGDEESPRLGTLDPDLLLWLDQQEYCLITRNRRSLPIHLKDHLGGGHHVPGIFIVRSGARMGDVVEDLLLIFVASRPDEFRDQIVYLPM